MSDADARRTATRCYERNLVVVAGAGTGKTSLLIERLLNQALERDLAPDELAAITFTEKSAAELRSRLEAGLVRLAALARTRAKTDALDPAREADRAYAHLCTRQPARVLHYRAERLRQELSRASIATIHAYCAALLRRFPAETGLDPDFAIDEGPRFDALRAEVWEDFLYGAEGPEGALREAWTDVLAQLDLAELRELGWRLASFELPVGEPRLAPAERLLREMVEERLRENTGALGEAAPGPESYLAAAEDVLRALLDGGLPRFRAALARARFHAARGPRDLQGSAAPQSRNAREATRAARATQRLLDQLERVDDELFARALALVAPFAERVFAEVRRRNLLPFDALLRIARDLLASHHALRRGLSRQLRLILIDEFQDTDPLQYEIAFFLAEAEGGPQTSEAFETALAPGKLFVVGDPKQAIYRFRGADIAAYERAVAHVLRSGGERLTLVQSFRAGPELLEPLDRAFPPLLTAPSPRERRAYSGYDPLVSGQPRGPGPAVEVWSVGDDLGRSADRARRDEADALADWIARERTAGRVALRDVAVLFRASFSMPAYVGALRERGIPYALETGRDMLDRPEGQQLLALLRALADPEDAPAVLGVLRSPLGAVPDSELAAWAASAPASAAAWRYVDALPDPGRFPELARTYALLCEWHALSLRAAPDELLARLADDACLLPLHAAAVDGAQRVANLRARLDPLTELARADPAHTLATILPWLERAEQPVGPPAERGDELELMTIHAAKGLEFPVVVLPDLGRSPRGNRLREANTELNWLRDERSLAASTTGPLSAGALVREVEEELHETAENRRLFYVAATRAQQRLVLIHAPRARTQPDAPVHHLAPWGYPPEGLRVDGALPDAPDVQHRLVSISGPRLRLVPRPPAPDLAAAVARARDIATRARAGARPAFRHPAGLREEADARLEALDERGAVPRPARLVPGRELALETGTLLHDVLERWDFASPEGAADLLRRAATRLARDTGREPAELERHARPVLDAFLRSGLPDWLRSVRVLGRELPLLVRDEAGQGWSGSIDLLYEEPGGAGRLVVADYKTDAKPDPATSEAYRPQLEIYGRAVARAFPEAGPPALELVYLRTGERVRL